MPHREISRDEVAEHCDYSSCWVIIHNDVVDITQFLEKHPGSAELLLEYVSYPINPLSQSQSDVRSITPTESSLFFPLCILLISLYLQAGSDATGAFEDVGHSMAARMLCDKYKLGTLSEKDRVKEEGSQFIAYAKVRLSSL